MKKFFLLLLAMMIFPGSNFPQQYEAKSPDLANAAKLFIEQLAKGDFDNATNTFDGTMKNVLPSAKLREVWQTLNVQAGAFKRQGEIRLKTEHGLNVVLVTCQFEKVSLDARIVFNNTNQITGLFFVPVETVKNEYTAHAYVKQTAFHEVDVRVGDGEWSLPGPLSLPFGKGPFPAVVLVHGSGPN